MGHFARMTPLALAYLLGVCASQAESELKLAADAASRTDFVAAESHWRHSERLEARGLRVLQTLKQKV